MNEDHADALALYAQVFGQAPAGVKAKMQSIDTDGMDLLIDLNGISSPCALLLSVPCRILKTPTTP